MYISIDLETTGLDPKKHQIIEFAAVLWANDGPIETQPYWNSMVYPGPEIRGDIIALAMHGNRLRDVLEAPACEEVLKSFFAWLDDQGIEADGSNHLLGKNVGAFDLQFLLNFEGWRSEYFSHRILDVGSMYATKDGIPKLQEIPDLSWLVWDENQVHTALYDAQMTLEAARLKLGQNEKIEPEKIKPEKIEPEKRKTLKERVDSLIYYGGHDEAYEHFCATCEFCYHMWAVNDLSKAETVFIWAQEIAEFSRQWAIDEYGTLDEQEIHNGYFER